MKTVLITGCSSGFGLAAAKRFAAAGWSVLATPARTGAPAGGRGAAPPSPESPC